MQFPTHRVDEYACKTHTMVVRLEFTWIHESSQRERVGGGRRKSEKGKIAGFAWKETRQNDSRERKRKSIGISGENSEFSPISRLRVENQRIEKQKWWQLSLFLSRSGREKAEREIEKKKKEEKRKDRQRRPQFRLLSKSFSVTFPASLVFRDLVDTREHRIADFLRTYGDNKAAEKCAPARTTVVGISRNPPPLCQPCRRGRSTRWRSKDPADRKHCNRTRVDRSSVGGGG